MVFSPPPPKIFRGRDKLIDRIVCSAECLIVNRPNRRWGIGETSINPTALHDHWIRRRFGQNRRVIRCDEFPASRAHFLRQLSKFISAGIENLEDLCPLRQPLSSEEIPIDLDNAESILDSQGSNAEEMYAAMNELTQSGSVRVRITSRISTIPPHCKTIGISTSSIEAAQDIFYRIYRHDEIGSTAS